MKRIGYSCGLVLIAALLVGLPPQAVAQGAQVRQSLKAAVMQRLGMTVQRNPDPGPPWFQVVGILENPEIRTRIRA